MQFVCKYSDVFGRIALFMSLRHCIISFLMVVFCVEASCIPARRTPVCLTQPDGTAFMALIKGDEFARIKTTMSGHAVIQDENGWWCYASYGPDGKKTSTGWRVGTDAPAEVLASSTEIPYGAISDAASRKRLEVPAEDEAILTRMRRISPETRQGPATKHGLVILANFSDVKFRHTKEEFEKLLNQEGYSVNGATGSAKDYFDDQFKGLLEFEFQVADIVTLPRTRAYYGANDSDGNDKKPAEMIRDACRMADDQIDFSVYDDDKDGKVDNIFLFFAGHDEAEGGAEECIWSHAWFIYSGARIDLVLDGTRIDRYACASELLLLHDQQGGQREFISGIGTFCHEYSHTLGLPDFYDTDYEESGGISAGFWTATSLMDGGNFNNMGNTPPNYNALERMIAGISQPESITETGTYRLNPVNEEGRSYMYSGTGGADFFLFECRIAKGWDAHIGGSGLLAYHIDLTESSFQDWVTFNEVNVDPEDQKADLLEADGRPDGFRKMEDFQSYRSNLAGIFRPYQETDFLNTDLFSVTAIRREGDVIKMNFIGNDGTRVPPKAENIVKDVFADAAIISFESSYAYEGEATVVWGRTGSPKDTLKTLPYEPGKYAVVLEGMEPDGKTYDVDIVFIRNGMEGETVTASVMTKRTPSVKWPYIYLGSVKRNDDGSFPPESKLPLRVYGAKDAAEIGWTFNDMPISVGGDGYYTVKTSGTLKVIIFWEDGSVDKVVKQIQVTRDKLQ